MLNKVRRKFILSGVFATFMVTLALILSINLINYMQTARTLSAIMAELKKMETEPPSVDTAQEEAAGTSKEAPPPPSAAGEQDIRRARRFSAQVQYAGRYFVLTLSDGAVSVSSAQTEMTEEEAEQLAQAILGQNKKSGFQDGYRYTVSSADSADQQNVTVIRLLDCSTELSAMRSLLFISVAVGLSGILLAFLFILRMSGKAIWPLRESLEKQKRFITDAGHELKTPLSVIGTNMDILAMDDPGNEWIQGTKKQVGRMRTLVNYLISLSRLEESQTVPDPVWFSLSELAADTVETFSGIGEAQDTPLICSIEPRLEVKADEGSLRQLLTILTDNALKYALPSTKVQIRLYRQGRRIVFETCNEWDHSTPPERLNRFFDRFYRGDAARSGQGKARGYGLGLSIAQTIAEKNHIQLSVTEDGEGLIIFQVLFAPQLSRSS